MKTLVIFVLLSPICFLCNSAAAAAIQGPSLVSQSCCHNCSQFKICPGRVKQVTLQNECSLKAILITTLSDREICLDGNWDYAKKLLTDFQRSGPSSVKCRGRA